MEILLKMFDNVLYIGETSNSLLPLLEDKISFAIYVCWLKTMERSIMFS